MSLEDSKKWGIKKIDSETERLVSEKGFDYDNKHFSLDLASRTNWLALRTLENDLVWPVAITTSDGETYSLTKTNLSTFITAGLAVYRGASHSGRLLKEQIKAAQTEEELHQVALVIE